MGEILLYWIENKLGLDLPCFQDPKKFRKAVSNGYLIGEILRKFNVISDDQCVSLKKNLTNKYCVKNMQHLHKWLRDGGLDVEFDDLLSIVQEQPGAAMKFIYRLYLWLESPKSYTIAGFKSLPTLKKQFREAELEAQEGSSCQILNDPANVIEFQPWHTLADRNRTLANDVQFIMEHKDNIYYEVPLQPPVLLNVKPFGGVATPEEPENLYFDFKTIKSDPNKRYNIYDDWRNRPKNTLCSRMRVPSEKEQLKAQLEMKRRKELAESMDEMNQFNSAALHNPTRVTDQHGKIYEDGRGDVGDYKKSLKILKERKQQEQDLNTERNNYRQQLTCKVLSQIPCQSYAALENNVLGRIIQIPSREKTLAEFVTTTHSFKQGFLDHMIFQQGQIAELKKFDLEKQWNINQQENVLQYCLEQQNTKLEKNIQAEQLLAQQEAVFQKDRSDVEGILSNLLDMVIKVTTYREAAGYDPPEPLLNEWKQTFHAMDKAAESNLRGDDDTEELDLLDRLRVNEYIFRTGEWNLELPNPDLNLPLEENEQLKKIVSFILESIFSPIELEPQLTSPDFLGAVALCGINFNWKPNLVRETLSDVAEPHAKLHVLDATNIVQEAIKAYANSLLVTTEPEGQGQHEKMNLLYPDEMEGEFQTLWSQHDHQATLDPSHNPKNDETDESGTTATGVAFKPDLTSDSATFKSKTKKMKSKYALKKSRKNLLGDADKPEKKRRHTKKKHSTHHDPNDKQFSVNAPKIYDETDEMSTDIEAKTDNGEESSTNMSFDKVLDEDGHTITRKSLDNALHKKKPKKEKKKKRLGSKTVAEFSNTLQIVKDTLKVDVGTEDDVQVLFSPEDQPETWPEFVKLGKLALEQLLRGEAIDDHVCSRIIVERMRHYSGDSFVVIINYPHALCQALSLENAVKPNNAPRPPCYHHADILVQKYKELRSSEAGSLINMAMQAPVIPHKHQSALFKYSDGHENEILEPLTKSFLDAVIIADVNLSSKLRDAQIMNNLDDLRDKMMEIPERSVEERLAVLLHLAFLQLKKFYTDLGIGYSIELGYDDLSYYLVMKEYVQNIMDTRRKSFSDASSKISDYNDLYHNQMLNYQHSFLGEYDGEDHEDYYLTPSYQKQIPSIQSDNSESVSSAAGTDSGKRKSHKHGGHKQPHRKRGSKDTQKSDKEDSVIGHDQEKEKHGKKHHDKKKKHKEVLIKSEDHSKHDVEIKPSDHIPPPLPSPIVYNIHADSVSFLGNFWTKMESTYLYGLKRALGAIRTHHDRILDYSINFQTQLKQFLKRPDKKQDLLTQFQEKFNQVSGYIRGDYEVKAELHNRVTELRDRLSAICDEKHDDSVTEMYSILNEGYLEGESEILTNLFITLIQLEADHYCDVIQFINDFYAMTGLGKPETVPWQDMLRINLLGKEETQLNEELKQDQSSIQILPSTSTQSKLSDAESSPSKSGKKTKSKKKKKSSNKKKDQKTLKDKDRKSKKTSLDSSQSEIDRDDEDEDEEEEEKQENVVDHGDGLVNTKEMPKSVKTYFGDDEGPEEIEIKKSYKSEIEKGHQRNLNYLDKVMKIVAENVSKIENYTTKLIKSTIPAKSSHLLPEDDHHSHSQTNTKTVVNSTFPLSGKKKSPKKEEKSKKRSKGHKTKGKPNSPEKEGKKKKLGKDSDHKQHKKKHDKSPDSRKKKKDHDKDVSHPDHPKHDQVHISLTSSTPKLGHSETLMSGKEKGSRRNREWQQAVELEGKRAKLQLALIEEKAKKEMNQLNDILLKVISGGETDAASFYKNQIENVATVCDVFRFAVENGTPLELKLELDLAKKLVSLGPSNSQCDFQAEDSGQLDHEGEGQEEEEDHEQDEDAIESLAIV